MPDYNKKTRQRIKDTSVRLACDANDMSIVEFGKLIIEQDILVLKTTQHQNGLNGLRQRKC